MNPFGSCWRTSARPTSNAFDIGLGFANERAGAFGFGLGALDAVGGGEISLQQGLEPLVVGLSVGGSGLTVAHGGLRGGDVVAEGLDLETDEFELRLRAGHLGLVGARVEFEKQGSGFDLLVVHHMQAHNRSADLRGHADDIRADLGVLGAREDAEVRGDGEHGKSGGGEDNHPQDPNDKMATGGEGTHAAEKNTIHTPQVSNAKREGTMRTAGRRAAPRPRRARIWPASQVPRAPATMQASQAGK